MPRLAVLLVRAIGVAEGQTETTVVLSDFVKHMSRSPHLDPFPKDIQEAGCSQRVTRLLREPVQVTDRGVSYVLTLVTRPKRRMYDKTKSLVLRRGVLPDRPDVVDPGTTASAVQPASRPPFDSDVLRRLEAVEMQLAVHGAPQGSAASTTTGKTLDDLQADIYDLQDAVTRLRRHLKLEE